MSVLAYPPNNDEEILRYCTKKCGFIASTEDQQFFALGCLFCSEKFLYFDVYIGHMQREHSSMGQNTGNYNDHNNTMYDASGQMCFNAPVGGDSNIVNNSSNNYGCIPNTDIDDLNETDAALLVPQMVMVKQELPDEHEIRAIQDSYSTLMAMPPNISNPSDVYIKQENDDTLINMDSTGPDYYGSEPFGNDDISGDGFFEDGEEDVSTKDYDEYDDDDGDDGNDGNDNYDDLVEESLLHDSESGLAMHIKDRKMIQFVIDSYRRNPYLWDHRNPNFRDRKRRQQFLDWMLTEFKKRFNVSLARDAITRKWDNLRTVYKRECNRMSLERTNISTLWYFRELHFLNRLYGGPSKISEAVVKETVYRRRYSALWNDVSTSRLLAMVRNYPCFYDKNHEDYRSKEKRGEALQIMANELQKLIDVTTIQISKRISQLRFDYSKQKHERLQCEQSNKSFVPSYSYYEQMLFMDADIAPFKCEFCEVILQTSRELETHLIVHQNPNQNGYVCPICDAIFPAIEQFQRHKHTQHSTAALQQSQQQPPTTPQPISSQSQSTIKEPKYFCDLCTASFREKSNYEEHMRRHNDELLLPGLADVNFDVPSNIQNNQKDSSAQSNYQHRPYICDTCGKSFTSAGYLTAHMKTHVGSGGSGDRVFRCDFPNCGRSYVLRQSYLEHMRKHYINDGAKCDVCGKTFKSLKNLQNHKQIHDAIKRYVCKICGSAFAQAAGLYLHKRRHTRNPDGHVDRHRGRHTQ